MPTPMHPAKRGGTAWFIETLPDQHPIAEAIRRHMITQAMTSYTGCYKTLSCASLRFLRPWDASCRHLCSAGSPSGTVTAHENLRHNQ